MTLSEMAADCMICSARLLAATKAACTTASLVGAASADVCARSRPPAGRDASALAALKAARRCLSATEAACAAIARSRVGMTK